MFTTVMDSETAAHGRAPRRQRAPQGREPQLAQTFATVPAVPSIPTTLPPKRKNVAKWVAPVIVGTLVLVIGILMVVFLYPWKHRKHSGKGEDSHPPSNGNPPAPSPPPNEGTYETLFSKATQEGKLERDAHLQALAQLCQMGDSVACSQMAQEVGTAIQHPPATTLLNTNTKAGTSSSIVDLNALAEDTPSSTAPAAAYATQRGLATIPEEDDDDDFTPV